jgi:hypothetical protein
MGTCLIAALIAAGCATPVLDKARLKYYENQPQAGLEALTDADVPERDKVIFLMERGSLYQLDGQYEESARDFNQADALLRRRDTLSVTHGAASIIANDNMLNFYGYPFERTYLHVINVFNYLALSRWQGAGVEARRIIKTLKQGELGKYPADAFSRYLAGLCFELVDDPSNARVEYRKASLISKLVDVSDYGMLVAEGSINPDDSSSQPPPPNRNQSYLVCIILLGRIGDYSMSWPRGSETTPIVTLSYNGKELGKAVTLADLGGLAAESEKQLALKKAAKTGARVAAKVAVVDSVSEDHEVMGFLLYLLLFSMEQPDFRHWETLPRFINVARVPCPPNLKTLELSVEGEGYLTGKRTVSVTHQIQHKGLLMVTFERGF